MRAEDLRPEEGHGGLPGGAAGQVWDLLDRFEAIEPSEGFRDRVVDALRAERARLRRGQAVRRSALLAAAGILLAVALVFPVPRGREPTPPAETAEAEVIESLELIEDMEILETFGEELDLAMEYDLYRLLSDREGEAR